MDTKPIYYTMWTEYKNIFKHIHIHIHIYFNIFVAAYTKNSCSKTTLWNRPAICTVLDASAQTHIRGPALFAMSVSVCVNNVHVGVVAYRHTHIHVLILTCRHRSKFSHSAQCTRMPWISSWQLVQLYFVNKSAIVVIPTLNSAFSWINEYAKNALCDRRHLGPRTELPYRSKHASTLVLLVWPAQQ